MTGQCSELSALIASLLALERHVVGITFLVNRDAYDKASATPMRAKIAYCVMVKAAMAGRSVKLAAPFSGCNGGSRALGFTPPTEAFLSGQLYGGFGLYRDQSISQQVAGGMTVRGSACYGVLAQPLENYGDDMLPDVVIIVTDARNAMRLVQGYTYHHGAQPVMKIAGNQALCSECTAHPLERDQMNVSLLCSGTRFLARWKTHELAIGLPFSACAATVDGLLHTADAVELDPAKEAIRERLLDRGLADPGFRLGYTYYTDLEKKKKLQPRQSS